MSSDTMYQMTPPWHIVVTEVLKAAEVHFKVDSSVLHSIQTQLKLLVTEFNAQCAAEHAK